MSGNITSQTTEKPVNIYPVITRSLWFSNNTERLDANLACTLTEHLLYCDPITHPHTATEVSHIRLLAIPPAKFPISHQKKSWGHIELVKGRPDYPILRFRNRTNLG